MFSYKIIKSILKKKYWIFLNFVLRSNYYTIKSYCNVKLIQNLEKKWDVCDET